MGVHTPSKTAYPLTQQHFQLKIDIFTSKTGKHDAYHGKHYAYREQHTKPLSLIVCGWVSVGLLASWDNGMQNQKAHTSSLV